ncbi:MAG: branched-chain amino acid ABC transporter substrate-binding protein [bacterium]
MRINGKSKILLVLWMISLGWFVGCGKVEKAGVTKEEEVKIALAGPLTGDIAAMGQGMSNACKMAIDDANASLKLKGIRLEFLPVDDRADPQEAVTIANQLISDQKVIGVIGHLNSGCSIPASKVYHQKKIVMITPASTNPGLTLQGFKNVFRVCTTDDVQGSFAADLVYKKLGLKKVSIIHDKTPYGQGLAEEFKKQFTANGGNPLSFDGINIGDKDFKALLIKINANKPEAIYFGGVYSECGLIAKQAKEIGFSGTIITGDGVFSPEYIKIGGKATENNIITMVGSPPEKLPLAAEFIKRYKKKYPNVDIQPYDAYTYEATNILIDAISHVGTDKNAIIDYICDVEYKGILGTTSFDEKGDTLNRIITAYIVKDGKFEVLK